jgi:hypothetical protein
VQLRPPGAQHDPRLLADDVVLPYGVQYLLRYALLCTLRMEMSLLLDSNLHILDAFPYNHSSARSSTSVLIVYPRVRVNDETKLYLRKNRP